MSYLSLFHRNNGCTNAPPLYVIRTLPVLLRVRIVIADFDILFHIYRLSVVQPISKVAVLQQPDMTARGVMFPQQCRYGLLCCLFMIAFRLTGGYLLVGGTCCIYLQRIFVPYFIVFPVGLKYFPSSVI
jgi:hypothetical protein